MRSSLEVLKTKWAVLTKVWVKTRVNSWMVWKNTLNVCLERNTENITARLGNGSKSPGTKKPLKNFRLRRSSTRRVAFRTFLNTSRNITTVRRRRRKFGGYLTDKTPIYPIETSLKYLNSEIWTIQAEESKAHPAKSFKSEKSPDLLYNFFEIWSVGLRPTTKIWISTSVVPGSTPDCRLW